MILLHTRAFKGNNLHVREETRQRHNRHKCSEILQTRAATSNNEAFITRPPRGLALFLNAIDIAGKIMELPPLLLHLVHLYHPFVALWIHAISDGVQSELLLVLKVIVLDGLPHLVRDVLVDLNIIALEHWLPGPGCDQLLVLLRALTAQGGEVVVVLISVRSLRDVVAATVAIVGVLRYVFHLRFFNQFAFGLQVVPVRV